MAREDCLERVSHVFRLWGVKYTTNDLGNGHIELRWRASPDKEERRYSIARTSSDWRAPANNEAHVKRLFRHDGLTLDKGKPAKPVPMLEKALSVPTYVEKDADQIRFMRYDISDLGEMVMALAETVEKLGTTIAQMMQPPEPSPSAPQIAALELVPAPISEKARTRRINPFEFLTFNWNSIDVLARDMGLTKVQTYAKLYKLTKGDDATVEMQRGLWRKKRSAEVIPAGVIAKNRKKLNGHANGKLNGKHH